MGYERLLTLHELLAGILLEEGFMHDGTSEVVDHELEDGLELLFSVSCIVGNSRILRTVRDGQETHRKENLPSHHDLG